MELAFEKNAVDHLQKLVCQVASQEETAETVVPDSLPDVGRIVGCWGVPVIRSKEWRQNGMGASGGISAWVLYVPEEGGPARQVSVYLPFTVKWEFPPTEQEGQMRVSCRLRSIDARMVNSRKILVRASLACQGEAYCPGQAVFYTLPAPPKELEVLRQRLPLQLPTELTEKSFLLDEELELPGGAPAVREMVSYQVRPMVTDAKVLGEKAVFKGTCGLHFLYMTPEDRLAVWDFELPFSQYTELSRVYDQEEELQIEPVLTGVEVTADEEGRRLRLKCSVAAQCLVLAKQTVDLVQDLYSLRCGVTPQLQRLPMKSRLDRQQLREQAESSFPWRVGRSLTAPSPRICRRSAGKGRRWRLSLPSGVVCCITTSPESFRGGPPTRRPCPGSVWPMGAPVRPPVRSPVPCSGLPAAALPRFVRPWR